MNRQMAGGSGRAAVAVAVLAAGMAGAPDSGAAAPATAAAGDPYGRAWSACQKSGLVAGSDRAAHFRACFRETALVAIEEQPAGKPRPPRLRYFYADGRPAALRGEHPPAAAGAAGAAAVPVAIDWRPDGVASRAVRTEHFGEVRLADSEVRAALARAEALAQAAAPLRVSP